MISTVVDASAKPASGFVFGNNFWLGSRDQCNNMNKPISSMISNRYERTMILNLLEDFPPFDVELKMAYVLHRSPMQIDLKIMLEHVLHLGLCLPKSCGNDDVQLLLQETFNEIDSTQDMKMQPKVLEVKDLKIKAQFFFRTSLWLLLAFVAVIVLLTRLSLNFEKAIKIDENQNIANAMENERKLSNWDSFIKCFNKNDNIKFIRSRESSTAAVNSIAGLR